MKPKPTTKRQLSEREYETLQYIKQYMGTHGYAPSIREIDQEMKLNSTSLASYYLDGLVVKGWIRREPRLARAITLVEG